jgi:hypothetical protein
VKWGQVAGGGRGRAWGGLARPLLRAVGYSLGLGLGAHVGWPRFDYLVGLLPFFCLLRFLNLVPFWYEFLVLGVNSYRVTILPVQVEFGQ